MLMSNQCRLNLNKSFMLTELQNLVIASHNRGKINEFKSLLQGYSMQVSAQRDYALAEVDEIGLTFVENAILKARHCAQQTEMPALADDSGLAVVALGGQPGVHSARYVSADASAEGRNIHLLKALENVHDEHRQACFHCVLVLLPRWDDPAPIVAHGSWLGSIARVARGTSGFGYDPVFIPDGLAVTVAELSMAYKNRNSHRAKAWQLLESCSGCLSIANK